MVEKCYFLFKIEELKCSKHTQQHVICGLIFIPIKQLLATLFLDNLPINWIMSMLE